MPRMEVAQNATVGFRLPAEMRSYLQRRAQEEHTTVSRYLVMLILVDMMDNEHAEKMEVALKKGEPA